MLFLTRVHTPEGARWAADGKLLDANVHLGMLLAQPRHKLLPLIEALSTEQNASGALLAPIERDQEVWASGVTYLRSREARMHESETADIYDKVYEAQRPELFFKALGWRVSGPDRPIRVRADAKWNVPEPELTLVANAAGEIVGYCAGNDVSSRDIEGENPLYLPQAKVYDGSCALGPGIRLISNETELTELPIQLSIDRAGERVFSGTTASSKLKRLPQELIDVLFDELRFPNGVFLMTGAGIVPDDQFTLTEGDSVTIDVGPLQLTNPVNA